jgi:hypothetical protein
VPDPATIHLVRQAFELRAAGRTLAEINRITHLYKSLNCYKTFFTNRLYIGELVFGDLVIPGYCEPVVPMNIWAAVQARVKESAARANLHTRNHPRRVQSRYLLSGLAYCARCGSPLFGAGSAQRNGHNYDRYACAAAVRRRDCDLKPIPRAVLEQAVLATVQDHILQPDMLEATRIRSQQAEQEYQAHSAEEQAGLLKQLGNIRRRIVNITAAIADAGPGRALTEKLRALDAEEAELLAKLAQLGDRRPLTVHDEGQLVQIREQFASDPRTVLRGFIARITVDRDGQDVMGEITWYYPP